MIDFVDTDLENANFENTELVIVDFHNANLKRANLKGTKFKKLHIIEEMFNQIKDNLGREQREGTIISYKKFMRKMMF